MSERTDADRLKDFVDVNLDAAAIDELCGNLRMHIHFHKALEWDAMLTELLSTRKEPRTG